MNSPLMPKSTAVWLIDNTSLTFEQIAKFCNLHVLEVQGIADGEVAIGIQGKSPIIAGELTLEEINKTHEFIKNHNSKFSNYKILYGGSVKANNAKEIVSLSNVDGALIGGASLKFDDFAKIIAD